jgi:hypothetical protein
MKRNNLSQFLVSAKACLLACSLFATLSCKKDQEAVAPQAEKAPASTETLVQYLESTGFNRDNIVLKDGQFIIEDDILIAREEVEKYAAKGSPSSPSGRVEHYKGYYVVSNTYVTNIKFYIEPTVPSDWKTAIRGAISQWNAINGTKLYLSETTSSSTANTRINTGYDTGNWVARAYLPSSDGRPGYLMTINTKYNYLSSGYKLFTIVHEMGHNFGLYHTDQRQGVFIQGTPTSDANSVMNSYVLPWNGFTSGDVKAVQVIYPQ